MNPRDRFWVVAACGAVLVVLAVITARPLLLFAAGALGTWLGIQNAAAQWRATAVRSAVTVTQEVEQACVQADQDIVLTIRAALPEPIPEPLTLEWTAPTGGRVVAAQSRHLEIPPGETTAETELTLQFPFAGTYSLTAPTVTITSQDRLYDSTTQLGPQREIIVDPEQPSNVYLGQAGEELQLRYGDHDATNTGSGLTPAEIREYVPSDPAKRIDWNALARLRELYVREFESETDRLMLLLMDARPSMGTGDSGVTQLAYAQHVALLLAEVASDRGDAIGFYGVGEDGLLSEVVAGTDAPRYQSVQDAVRNLTTETPNQQRGTARTQLPALVKQRTAVVGEDSQFSARLRPFLATQRGYIERLASDPLVETIRRYVHARQRERTVWTALFTDDSNRGEVYEAVKTARQGYNRVLVFLLPDVLFEADGLRDIEAAYDQYRDFVEFRKRLDRLDRVTAYELGPADRVEAVLAYRRNRPAATTPSTP